MGRLNLGRRHDHYSRLDSSFIAYALQSKSKTKPYNLRNKMRPHKIHPLQYTWKGLIRHQQPLCLRRQSSLVKHTPPLPPRVLIPAPKPNSGPLLEYRSDRELPPLPSFWAVWGRSLPIFIAILTASALFIFNYQKSSSSVVSATLYSLRTSELSRKELGDEIYFRDQFPWIWGEMNQLQGRINIHFAVKGTKGSGMVYFRSVRHGRMGKFETKEWSLEMADGRKIELLNAGMGYSTTGPSWERQTMG